MPKQTKIAASILNADFTRLGDQVQAALEAGADWVHVDVMDAHFVPVLTMGPHVVAALRPLARAAGAPIDVHLMVAHPERLIPDFAQAGADYLTVHVETCPHLQRTIAQIKELGVRAGVTLNPATPLGALEEILPDVDLVLVMSVSPGYGGQSYLPSSSRRIARVRQMLAERGLDHVELEVDGGIKAGNAAEVAAAGASVLVIGSAIFRGQGAIAENLAGLRAALSAGPQPAA